MINIGKRARVNYVGMLDDGTVFDSTYERGVPLELTIGSMTLPPAVERALAQMRAGEHRAVTVFSDEAYGAYDESLIEIVPATAIPNADALPVGDYIMLQTPVGLQRIKVVKVEDGMVYFDLNHEFAGRDLRFELELVEFIQESYIERELHPAGCGCGCELLKESLGA
ncbi:MAG: FKBP-type peptidyl-prolyl cis-trans isomerase [Eggerthellaceae bacterium]|nr:FKBP-type peptidyl-prolyl cis-trans isomerase [Eggerthellaceae bacterium]